VCKLAAQTRKDGRRKEGQRKMEVERNVFPIKN
jgi:exosome complex RNA-binding protein Rrp42 (RNase PH superfamily)